VSGERPIPMLLCPPQIPTWTGVRLNLGLCGKSLESNELSDGMDVDLSDISIMDINSNVVSQY
jgi:hypothetical protein